MKKERNRKVKRVLSVAVAALMFSLNANAMVTEGIFPSNEQVTDFGWTYKDTSAMRVSAEMSVLNGKLTWAALVSNYFVTPTGERGNFYKTFENETKSGVFTFSVDVTPVTKDSINNGAERDVFKPTIEFSDGTNVVAKVELAGNYKSIKVNNEFIAPARDEVVFGAGKTAKIDVIIDYDNDECYIMKDGSTISTVKGKEEYTKTALLNKDVAITRCDFKVSNANLKVDPVLLDNISLHSSVLDGNIFEDNFDDPQKSCIEDYGYYAVKNAFLYRTENGIHIKNANPDGNTNIWLTKKFDNVTSGKMVFDFSLNAYKEDGVTRTRPYDNKYYPMFSLNSGDTKRFYCQSTAGATTIGTLKINDTQINTNLVGKTWADGYFSDIRLVVDLDNSSVEIYAHNPNVDDYQKVNKESLSLLNGTGIDSISFGREAFGKSLPGYYHITNLKIYNITEGGYTRPVVMQDGRNSVDEIIPGKTVDIYAAAANVVNNPEAKLIVAYYNENGKFIKLDIADFTAISSGIGTDVFNAELVKLSYTFPADVAEGAKFKAFVWNGTDDMIPLTESTEISMSATVSE